MLAFLSYTYFVLGSVRSRYILRFCQELHKFQVLMAKRLASEKEFGEGQKIRFDISLLHNSNYRKRSRKRGRLRLGRYQE